jgi:hypothetical protein
MPLDTISNSARAELAAINVQLAEAVTIRAGKQEAVDRLSRPAARLEAAVAAHAVEKAVYDAEIKTWYSNGCVGARPAVPLSLEMAERNIGEARRDLGATDDALETAKRELQEANDVVVALQLRQRNPLYRCAVEKAAWRLRTRAVPQLIAALAEFGVVESLEVELRNRGYGQNPHPEALSYADHVRQQLTIVRQSTAVRGDLEAARQFLDELANDPYTDLPDPGPAKVEYVEPRLPKAAAATRYVSVGPGHEAPPAYEPVHDPFFENPVRAAQIAREAGLVEGTSEAPGNNTGSPPLPGEAVLVQMPLTEIPAWLQSSSPTFMPAPRSG